MSIATVRTSRPLTTTAPVLKVGQSQVRRRSELSDAPRTGRGVGPPSRPRTVAPFHAGPPCGAVRACTAGVTQSAPVHLTERGIAVIVVTALLLFVSAAVVMGLTAVRVTGPNYVPYGQTSLVER